MNQMHRKMFLGLVMVMAVALIFSTRATAGLVIEDYNSKLNGVQGAITKIEGNKLTIKNEAGKLIILRVRGFAEYKEPKFKIGDKVKIQDGNLIKMVQPNDRRTPGAGKVVQPND